MKMIMMEFKNVNCIFQRLVALIQEYDENTTKLRLKCGKSDNIEVKCIQERLKGIKQDENVLLLLQYTKNTKSLPEIVQLFNTKLTWEKFNKIIVKISLFQG